MTILGRRGGLLLLASLAAAPALAQQQPAGPTLTLEQAVAAARENNPDLQATRNDITPARAAVRAARADFLPSASASTSLGYTAGGVQRFGSVEFGEQPAYYSSSYNLSVQYDLSGAKLAQPGIARAQQAATEGRIASYEATLVRDVVEQYIQVLQSGEQVQQAEREVTRTREHERLANARVEVGTGTPLDVRRAQVQRGQAEITLAQFRSRYGTDLLLLGQRMGTFLDPATRLTTRFELFEPTWVADELVRQALETNPELLAARASIGAARGQVRAARSQYLPSLSFQVGLTGSVYSASDIDPLVQRQLGQLGGAFASCTETNVLRQAAGLPPVSCAELNPEDPAVRDAVRRQIAAGNPSFPFGYQRQPLQAGVTISLPLFDGLQRERRVEEARVAQTDAELAMRSLELRLEAGVRTTHLELLRAAQTIGLQRQVVENASEELRMARERFRLGATNSLEVVDAQTRLAEAERGLIDNIYVFHRYVAALEALVGRPLR